MKISPETWWTAVALGARTLGQVMLTAAAVVTLSPKDGGLWFVFVSLGGVVQFLDLGLTTMIMRAASQLHAGAARLTAKGLSDEKTDNGAPNMDALKNLYATTGNVYAFIALGVIALGAVAAMTALKPMLGSSEKLLAWGMYTLAAATQLMISQKTNLLQGVGELVKAQKLTTVGVVLALGAATAVMAPTGSLLAGCAMLAAGWSVGLMLFNGALGKYKGGHYDSELMAVLLPNSARAGIWRVAFACFYFLPVLIIGPAMGVEVAGSYGFTVQMCLLLTAVAQLPISSWLPKLNALAAHGTAEEFKAAFLPRLRMTMGIYIFGGILLVLAGPALLNLIHAKTPLLPGVMLVVLVVHFFFEAHRNNHVLVASAFNHLPFWKGDVISAVVLVAGGAWVLRVAPMEVYILWMVVVASSCNFWWSVAESLRQMKCSWVEYRQSVLGV